jgi:hypothetical protein
MKLRIIVLFAFSFLFSACEKVPHCSDDEVEESVLEETIGDPKLYHYVRFESIEEKSFNKEGKKRSCRAEISPTNDAVEMIKMQREKFNKSKDKSVGGALAMMIGVYESSFDRFHVDYDVYYDEANKYYRIKYQVDQSNVISNWAKFIKGVEQAYGEE